MTSTGCASLLAARAVGLSPSRDGAPARRQAVDRKRSTSHGVRTAAPFRVAALIRNQANFPDGGHVDFENGYEGAFSLTLMRIPLNS